MVGQLFLNDCLVELYKDVVVEHLPTIRSDRDPIDLYMISERKHNRIFPFSLRGKMVPSIQGSFYNLIRSI